MGKGIEPRWYWTADTGDGGWVHAGPCRLAGRLEGWTMFPCSAAPDIGNTELFWEPYPESNKYPCLVCKRNKPLEEGGDE